MSGARRAAVLALAPLLLAGCLGTITPSSAQTRLDLAQAAAHKWSPNATLAGVLGTEGSLAPQPPQGQEDAVPSPSVPRQALPVADNDVGDGRGLLWFFAFTAPDEEGILAVTSGPAVGGVRTGEYRGYDLEPLGEWELDSTDAVEAAMGTNGSFARAAAAPGARLYYELHQPRNGSASWRIYASPHPSKDGWSAKVDAVTGDATVQEGIPTWGWEDPRDGPGSLYGSGYGDEREPADR